MKMPYYKTELSECQFVFTGKIKSQICIFFLRQPCNAFALPFPKKDNQNIF